jgi:hypothetical protein
MMSETVDLLIVKEQLDQERESNVWLRARNRKLEEIIKKELPHIDIVTLKPKESKS